MRRRPPFLGRSTASAVFSGRSCILSLVNVKIGASFAISLALLFRKTQTPEVFKIVMRRYERASTQLTSNRLWKHWGKLLGDSVVVTAILDRLLHHGHVLKCGPRSWRTQTDLPDPGESG